MRPCTVYSCQVGNDKLTRAAVAERAAKIADAEGLEAVTIRRLAQELGVTPMALYWHFKNKDELLLGLADHLLSDVRSTRDPRDPWREQLRAMVNALVQVMRDHPCLPALLRMVDKQGATQFNRATNDALELLGRAGFELRESYWVASFLLQGAVGLVEMAPSCPTSMTPEQAAEWRRRKRIDLESLSASQYPFVVQFARTLEDEPDEDRYYGFGVDLIMAGIEAMAAKMPASK